MNKNLVNMPSSILADIAADLIRDNDNNILKHWDVDGRSYFELESKDNWGNKVLSIKLDDMPYFIEFEEVSITVDTLDDNGIYEITMNKTTYDKNLKVKDFDYEVLKEYKQKGRAIKNAQTFALENNFGYSGYVEHSTF